MPGLSPWFRAIDIRRLGQEIAGDRTKGVDMGGREMGIEIGFGRPVLVKYKETWVVG